MNLAEWTINYVKHKDSFQKKLKDYKQDQDVVEFNFSDKKHHYLISEKLEVSLLERIKKYDWKTIVCLNTEENLKVLIDNWKKFVGVDKLFVLFVSEKGGKWIINPKTHEAISDPESLNLGLKSMYDAAEGKYEEPKRE
jgi:hypothetical protein